ncbi:uncharacterized protein LOC128739964 [Sabethes cyaneus]|uniref:uncharacterized protein LOC128739964 n=1 Tax=Sabethes cyaneus TaxID=53552 RepID=UPI00237E5210|nr:uncharacterized protein LOC128739964 [Sabethes cyaneus]
MSSSKHSKSGSDKVTDTRSGSSKLAAADTAKLIPSSHPNTNIGPSPNAEVNVDITDKLNRIDLEKVPNKQTTVLNKNSKASNVVTVVRRNPPRNGRAIRVSNCQLCDELDNDNMVQCDSCDLWYHFICVNVTSEIENMSWSCSRCWAAVSNKQVAPPVEKSIHPGPPPSRQSRNSVRSGKSETRRRLKLQLQKIEEEKKLEKQFLDKKYEALLEYGSEASTVLSDTESFVDQASKVEQWVADTEHCGGGTDSGLAADELERHVAKNSMWPTEHHAQNLRQSGQQSTFPPGGQAPQEDYSIRFTVPPNATSLPMRRSQNQYPHAAALMGTSQFNPRQRSTPTGQGRAMASMGDETVCILNRTQLAARQAVSKDLPEFNGNPEDWPLFFSAFTNSTQMCGFSNEENMLRLRKCLRGRALEAVKCRLLHPSNVGGVLSTLKMLYGRPEAIVQAIVKKVRTLPSPNIDRLETVVNFALTVENLVATIQACEVHDFVYNASLRYELVERLPSTLKLDWAKHSRDKPNPNLVDFSSWLYSTAEDASAVMPSVSGESRYRPSRKDGCLNVHSESESSNNALYMTPSQAKSTVSSESNMRCPICMEGCTSVTKCQRFAELSNDSRWAAVRECKLCRKCLRKHNGSCRQQKACGTNGCTYLHHPLLHSDKQQLNSFSSPVPTAPTSAGTSQQSCNIHQGQSQLLFRILPVILYGPEKAVKVYAFIDDGSDISLMEEQLAEELGVIGPMKSLCLGWTGGAHRTEASSECVNLRISSCSKQPKQYELSSIHTVKSLRIRPQTLQYSELQTKYPYLSGLPIESYENAYPRILIGVDNLGIGNIQKCREGRNHEPVAVKMRIGWTLFGRCAPEGNVKHSINYHSVSVCRCNKDLDEDLHQIVKNFFSLDSLGISKPEKLLQSPENQRAHILLETLTIPRNKCYETGLLWKYDEIRLPDSKAMALKRWQCLDRRMKQDPVLAKAVKDKIEDHIRKGYVRKLSEEEIQAKHSRVWYLPMFPVVNQNKPGKTRLVWDAAAAVHGVSLNSVLLKGPDLLTSLLSILIQFREYRTAVCGDIREMYHQVRIREEDQHSQRFFWKDDETDSGPSTYVVQVMTFGACCSPSTAQYVKNTHARKFEQEYPAAVEAIVKHHYVDDMLLSVESESQAAQLSAEVKRIHALAGFEIRNWASNSPAVLQAMHEPTIGEKNLSGENTVEKILGMWWNTSTDNFTFKISTRIDKLLLSGCRRPTKREVLRTLMMIFDPLGLIGHFLMILKTLLQEIWRTSIGWDDMIDNTHFEKWTTWCAALPRITTIKIPRCYRIVTSTANETVVQLHTFVDASETGYASVAYLRYQEGSAIECALVGSKTKVSPLKFLSIPRSELQAAVIGVRLAETICQSLSVHVHRRFFWTDSKDVLCWLNSDHRRFNQYVAFRVSEILEATEVREWNWIPSKQNVADEGTKWKGNPDLSATSRWFRGPQFLWKPSEHWPVSNKPVGKTTEELRPHLLYHTKTEAPLIDVSRFSDWQKILRCTARIFRFVHNVKSYKQKKERKYGPLEREEFVNAECYLFRIAQTAAYTDEIAILSKNLNTENPDKCFPKNSPLYHQCAFLDHYNVLRAQGRTRACSFITKDAAQPVILPREHPITWLILHDFHKRFNHQNHEATMNEIRQRFRISKLKATYKRVRQDCQKCKNSHASPQPPLMADLPPQRLAAFAQPFTHMGVDYFGPMLVSVGRRSEKRWGVLATCLTIRAIHIELAHSLTTDSCILAIRNIMARRGVPATIISDHGTNFQGGSKELREALQNVNQEQLIKEFTTSDTEWTFIPTASPHMGGAWERLIRCVKSNLYKLQWRRLPTDEILHSTLLEIENMINSRPLTDIPMDEDDDSPVLTPNHFLLGSSNGLKPWVPCNVDPTMLRNNWKQSQRMTNEFWRWWLRDYLPVITRRTKWFTKVKPLETGDVVIIVDPNGPRNSWPLGRIIATKSGTDGQVRSATVQTNKGIYERPAVKLAVLDVGVRDQHAFGRPPAHSGGSVSSPVDQSTPRFTATT